MTKPRKQKVILLQYNHIPVLVDDEDYGWVSQYRWRLFLNKRNLYAVTSVSGQEILMHRLIMDAGPGQSIDHKNGDGLDNSRVNLRFATQKQNMANMKKRSGTTSKYKGVWHYAQINKWTARIQNEHLGCFDTEEEAAVTYNEAARIRFGEFARPNEFDEETERQIIRERDSKKKPRSSEYRGVSHAGVDTPSPWRANIRVNGKDHYLGRFAQEIDAAIAYNNAVMRLGARRSRLNVIIRKRSRKL